jgi:hypothetical protein
MWDRPSVWKNVYRLEYTNWGQVDAQMNDMNRGSAAQLAGWGDVEWKAPMSKDK